MRALFGYGTFRKAEWRAAILGAEYPTEPATLTGWRRIALASGYLSLRETVLQLGAVQGVLIELDGVGWQIADAWEELPLYGRVEVTVNTMRGPLVAETYVCANCAGATPVDTDCFARLPDARVESAIAAFQPTMRALRAST